MRLTIMADLNSGLGQSFVLTSATCRCMVCASESGDDPNGIMRYC